MSKILRYVRLIVPAIVAVLFAPAALGAACTSVATGNWNAQTTWGAAGTGCVGAVGGIPGTADTAAIANTHTVTTTAAVTVNGLTINAGGALSIGAFNFIVNTTTGVSGNLNFTSATGTKQFTGAVTINAGGVWNNAINAPVNFRGGLTHNGTTFTAGTGAYTFTTAAQAVGGTSPITIPNVTVTTIALTNNGNLTASATLGGTGSLVNSATGTLNIGGTSAITTLTATAAGNLVNYNGAAAQTIKATTYSNVAISKPAGIAATLGGNTTVGGTLTVTSGTLTVGAFTLSVTGATSVSGTLSITSATGAKTFIGAVTINPAGVWTNTTAAVIFRGGLAHSGATFTAGTGVYTFSTTAAQAVNCATALAIPSLTVTAPTVLTNNCPGLTVATALAGTGNLTNAATGILNIGNTSAITGLTASAVGNTVNYTRAGAQTIKTPTLSTYHHLGLSGSGAKTAAAGLTVNGDFTLSGTATLTAAAFTHNFAGNWIVNTTAAAPLSVATTSVINFNTPAIPAPTSMGGTTVATIAFADVNINNTSGVTFNDNASFSTGTTPTLTVAAGATLTPAAAVIISGTGTLTGGGTAQVTTTAAGGFTAQYTIATKTLTNLTVEYAGAAAQMVTAMTYPLLEVSNASGVALAGATTVSTLLTLNSGVVSTGANTLITTASCATSVSRISGWVAGNLQLQFPTGAPSCTFHVGDAAVYRPVTTAFASVTAAGPLVGTVSQAAGDHPNIASSGLDSAKSVNRYWTITDPVGGTIAYTTYSATFNFANPGDIDAGANALNFEAEYWNGAAWATTTVGTQAATSNQATGIANPSAANTYAAFAVAEKIRPVVVSINCSVSCAATSAATVSWAVTFSRSVTGVDATAFTLAQTGVSGAFITSVTGGGTSWTVIANTGIGSGTLGLNQTGPGSVVDAVNGKPLAGTFTGQVYTISATPALAEYRMDEASWNGTAGEVVDSSGSGNHAQAFNSASTTDGSRAIATNPGTCRYGVFDNGTTITQGYVQTPLPNLTADFTIAAWIRTTNNTIAGQRILIDDQNNTGGYGLSLGDGAAGILRFYSRGITPIIFDSTYTIANNIWYFVAAVADIANQKRTIYVFDTAGTLLNSTTEAAWTGGAWGTDAGLVSIGGEVNGPPQTEPPATFHFRGNLDEVRVYQKVLSQNALAAIAAQTHACPANIPDHFEIHSGGTGVTCTPSTLTVVACADATCATPYTLGVTGTLGAAGAPTVNWDGTTGGAAGAGFDIPVGGSSVTKNVQVTTPGSVVFGISAAAPAPANPTTCNFGSPSCTFTAADAGFLVSAPDHVAETASTLTVQAVKKADNSLACVPAFASVAKTVNLKCAYVNPATGTLPVRVGGAALNAAGNAAAACDGSGSNISLSFNASGIATPSLQYADVGNMQINASYTGAGLDAGLSMAGSGTFIAAPASFVFSGIPAAPLTAGQAFNATVTAKNSAGNTTSNFTGQTVAITSSNPQPGSGNATAIDASLTGFSGGAASTNLTWNEVGAIDLNASLANYLGSALSVAGSQAGVGRFHPAYFDTAVTQGCGTFTYGGTTTPAKAGQPFTVTVKAKRQGGDATDATNTANYMGAYAYATTLSNGGDSTGFTGNVLAAVDFASGVGTITTVQYAMATPQIAPVTLILRAIDGDTPAVSSSGHTEGTAEIRSGRVKLSNAHGSELLDLPVPMVAQYYNGTWFVTNTADSCTTATVPALTLTPGGTAVMRTWNSPFVNGNGGLKLGKPNAKGYVTVTVTAPAWLQYPWGGAAAVNPTARATFGVYKGSNEFIYLRETY